MFSLTLGPQLAAEALHQAQTEWKSAFFFLLSWRNTEIDLCFLFFWPQTKQSNLLHWNPFFCILSMFLEYECDHVNVHDEGGDSDRTTHACNVNVKTDKWIILVCTLLLILSACPTRNERGRNVPVPPYHTKVCSKCCQHWKEMYSC